MKIQTGRMVKRISFFLLLLLLLSFPFSSYAADTAVLTPGEYIISLMFSACGMDASLSSVSAALGSYTGYDEYMEKGAKRQLGSFSQHLYDLYNDADTQELIEARKKEIESLVTLTSSSSSVIWGQELEINGALLSSMKTWLASFPEYGTDETNYKKPFEIPDGYAGMYLTTSPYSGTHVYEGYRYLFSYYYVNSSGTEIYANAYSDKYSLSGLFGVLTSSSPYSLRLYALSSSDSSGYESARLSSGVKFISSSSGNWLTSTETFNGVSSDYLTSTLIDSCPFPVFTSMAQADSWIHGGTPGAAINAAFASTIVFVSVRPEIQKKAITVFPSSVTLPASEAAAKEQLQAVHDASDAALKETIAAGGMAVDWADSGGTDIPGTGEGTESMAKTLAAILAKVSAIPADIAAQLNKNNGNASESDGDQLSLPRTVMTKFPFCIPFDIAHLVESMNASAAAPKFELPMKFDYLSLHYEDVFIVDMADWEPAVRIFRIMLDLLFCAGLMAVTRELIRG